MILVDKNIKELVKNDLLIVNNYNEENVGAISYDLTIDTIIDEENEKEEFTLKPKEFVMIKTKEELLMPNNVLARITEKNSLLRTGLYISGPNYQPGHRTYAYLRVFNMSNNEIILKRNFKIAQVIFELLQETPDITYNQNKKASFNNESTYLKYGRYEEEYNRIIKK